MRVVYKRIVFRLEWYTKGLVLDESGIQKDRFQIRLSCKYKFQMRVVYKRIGFRREGDTKGQVLDKGIGFGGERHKEGQALDKSGIQKDKVLDERVYERTGCRREWYTKA